MKNKTYRRKTRLSHLPTELLQNILRRLSAKTIFLQVRSVSKTWYAIVTDPSFISMHADWWAKNHNEYLIFHHSSHIARLDKWFNFSEELKFPIGSEFKLIGSCNGLLCLRENIDYEKPRFPSTYIWNPCIKWAFKKLPHPQITHHHHHRYRIYSCVSAFGFDSQSNDYKVFHTVLGQVSYEKDEYVIVNWLYSLKTNSWKVIKGADDHDRSTNPCSYYTCQITYPCGCPTCWTYSNNNGAFYWTPDMRRRNSSCIMWFDFCDETIRKTKLPIDYDYEMRLYLVTFNNSLVLYVSDIPQNGRCTINAWMMNKLSDHTTTWSWDRTLSAVIPSPLIRSPHVKPLIIGLNGEFLVFTYFCHLHPDKLFFQLGVYDFKQQRMRVGNVNFVGDHTMDGFQDSFSYSESLVCF